MKCIRQQITKHILGEGPAQQMTKASWQRPPPPSLDQAKDRLVFQQVCSHKSPNDDDGDDNNDENGDNDDTASST